MSVPCFVVTEVYLLHQPVWHRLVDLIITCLLILRTHCLTLHLTGPPAKLSLLLEHTHPQTARTIDWDGEGCRPLSPTFRWQRPHTFQFILLILEACWCPVMEMKPHGALSYITKLSWIHWENKNDLVLICSLWSGLINQTEHKQELKLNCTFPLQ